MRVAHSSGFLGNHDCAVFDLGDPFSWAGVVLSEHRVGVEGVAGLDREQGLCWRCDARSLMEHVH